MHSRWQNGKVGIKDRLGNVKKVLELLRFSPVDYVPFLMSYDMHIELMHVVTRLYGEETNFRLKVISLENSTNNIQSNSRYLGMF